MSCKCHKTEASPLETAYIVPDQQCLDCAEKHLSEAYALSHEGGYEGINRWAIIGELALAQRHTMRSWREFALRIRAVRLKTQAGETITEAEWNEIHNTFNTNKKGEKR